jgi:hypothetical protein
MTPAGFDLGQGERTKPLEDPNPNRRHKSPDTRPRSAARGAHRTLTQKTTFDRHQGEPIDGHIP